MSTNAKAAQLYRSKTDDRWLHLLISNVIDGKSYDPQDVDVKITQLVNRAPVLDLTDELTARYSFKIEVRRTSTTLPVSREQEQLNFSFFAEKAILDYSLFECAVILDGDEANPKMSYFKYRDELILPTATSPASRSVEGTDPTDPNDPDDPDDPPEIPNPNPHDPIPAYDPFASQYLDKERPITIHIKYID